MALIHECPSCGKKLKIPDELIGKQVRCSDCAGTFVAEKARPAPPPPSSRRANRDREPERERDFDDEPRPSRRPRDDYRSDLEPHRGVLVMTFGITGFVLVFVSSGTYFLGGFAHTFVAVGGFPLQIIGLVLSILAWVWGSSDLARMKNGYMDPSGHGNTQAGYITGMIGAILHIISLVLACIITIVAVAIGAAVVGGACCLFSSLARSMPPPGQNPPPPRPTRSIVAPTETGLSRYLPDRFK